MDWKKINDWLLENEASIDSFLLVILVSWLLDNEPVIYIAELARQLTKEGRGIIGYLFCQWQSH